ncbi:NlpC/P60 family protein [Maribacter sp. 2-571]|uniref:C40 family peptidase n=1 Tax=Maribacter sp. 2-571 TaxID=3417569 RepID=UPI003D351951
MRAIIVLLCFFVSFGFCFVSCRPLDGEPEQAHFKDEISEIKEAYAPDKQVALFQIAPEKQGKIYVLKGESNLPEAVSALKEKLTAKNISYVDSVQLLPNADLAGKTKGLITISVANLRSNPKHSAELATQATLGTPVNVLKRDGEWYLIQTPDRYLAWVDHGGIVLMDENQWKGWKTGPKVMFTETYGQAYETPADNTKPISDLVAGNVLQLLEEQEGYYKVQFPDARIGYINMVAAVLYEEWLKGADNGVEGLVRTSKRFMGLPYLWGGTSSKGVDCSGYTKTIFFLNGMVIPRDASQQVHTGTLVDTLKNFDALQKGDLLFFGRKATDSTAEKVVHVGMWIGNNEFIHSSGKVHVSSMDDTAENFDAFNKDRYLRTKRLWKQEGQGLLQLSQASVFRD